MFCKPKFILLKLLKGQVQVLRSCIRAILCGEPWHHTWRQFHCNRMATLVGELHRLMPWLLSLNHIHEGLNDFCMYSTVGI